MSFEKGEFVHHKSGRLRFRQCRQLPFQSLSVYLTHRFPMQAGEFAYMGGGQFLAPYTHKSREP